jgi:hypothetical protein
MKCYSCNKQKNELIPTKSVLMPGNTLLLCQTCVDNKFEPRWVVVLAGRQFGFDYVRDFILKRRYEGKEISATELMV